MEFFDLSTLIPLIVAVFIFMKLRNVLGTRSGHQGPPKHMQGAPKPQNENLDQNDAQDNVIAMPGAKPMDDEETVFDKIDKIASKRTNLNKGLKAIHEADTSFDPEQFMQGAKSAYEMIINAFAEGDLETLKSLLSKTVYDEFATAIKERKARGETMISNFIGVIDEKFTTAQLVDDQAQVTIQFTTEMISAVADKNDDIIDGDPNQVIETVDEWTFARSTTSHDPNWLLIET